MRGKTKYMVHPPSSRTSSPIILSAVAYPCANAGIPPDLAAYAVYAAAASSMKNASDDGRFRPVLKTAFFISDTSLCKNMPLLRTK